MMVLVNSGYYAGREGRVVNLFTHKNERYTTVNFDGVDAYIVDSLLLVTRHSADDAKIPLLVKPPEGFFRSTPLSPTQARQEVDASEIQLLVATPSNGGIRMRVVMDGKEHDFFVSRQTAASIVANIAEALADQNQH